MQAKVLKHKWMLGNHFAVCSACGCRYRLGMVHREYEQPDGRRTTRAEACTPPTTHEGKI